MYQNDHSTVLNLYAKGRYPDMPAVADVRRGTAFGIANNLTGTAAIPSSDVVKLGVAVDATTGTGLVDNASVATAFWNLSTGASFDANSIGDRLSEILTVQEAGATVASYGVGE